jgi:hypothetical protein
MNRWRGTRRSWLVRQPARSRQGRLRPPRRIGSQSPDGGRRRRHAGAAGPARSPIFDRGSTGCQTGTRPRRTKKAASPSRCRTASASWSSVCPHPSEMHPRRCGPSHPPRGQALARLPAAARFRPRPPPLAARTTRPRGHRCRAPTRPAPCAPVTRLSRPRARARAGTATPADRRRPKPARREPTRGRGRPVPGCRRPLPARPRPTAGPEIPSPGRAVPAPGRSGQSPVVAAHRTPARPATTGWIAPTIGQIPGSPPTLSPRRPRA